MRTLACIAIAILVTAPGARADERESHLVVRQMGSDTFVTGDSPRVAQAVKGDLIAAGGDLRIAAPVAGDVIAVGGAVRIEARAGRDLYAAGCHMDLAGEVSRNARVAGCSVSLAPQARIAGNASLAGGRIEVLGGVGGYLQVAGGRVLIDGPVDGDVEVAAGELELGSQARIGGKLRYRSGAPLRQDADAQVRGGIERVEVPVREAAERSPAPAAFGIWTLGLMALAAILVVAMPGFFGRVADAARGRVGWSLLVGFLALVAVPAAIVVLVVTVIGIPLALLAVLGYLALLLVGYVTAGIALGNLALRKWFAARAARKGWRALAAALGVLAIGLVALIPWLGALIAFLALILGMGVLLLQLKVRAGTSGAA